MDQWRNFSRLSEAISTAAADPRTWPLFLEQFAILTNSNRLLLHRELIDPSRSGQFTYSHRPADSFNRDYAAYYGGILSSLTEIPFSCPAPRGSDRKAAVRRSFSPANTTTTS
jgi:hypothetical protein